MNLISTVRPGEKLAANRTALMKPYFTRDELQYISHNVNPFMLANNYLAYVPATNLVYLSGDIRRLVT